MRLLDDWAADEVADPEAFGEVVSLVLASGIESPLRWLSEGVRSCMWHSFAQLKCVGVGLVDYCNPREPVFSSTDQLCVYVAENC